MKLLRYGPKGKEKPGLVDGDGRIRDISRHVKDITPATLDSATLAKLRKLNPERQPLVKGKPRIGCPISGVPKFIAIGLNYVDHAKESGAPLRSSFPRTPTRRWRDAATCTRRSSRWNSRPGRGRRRSRVRSRARPR